MPQGEQSMKIQYTISEADYLTHQLYIASKSAIIKQRRQRAKFLYPFLYAAIGSFFLFQQKTALGISFMVLAVLWFLVYPIWERGYYLRHYKSFVKENMKSILDRNYTIEFLQNHFLSASDSSESKVNYSEIEGFAEVPTTFLIQIKGGKAIVFGKDQLSNPTELRSMFKGLSSRLKVPFFEDLDWQWK